MNGEGRWALVTLDRPEARNALTQQLWSDLAATVTELDQDPDVSVIIVTGAEPAFCAGFDLRGLAGERSSDLRSRMSERAAFTGMLPPTGKPVIGAVNGAAVTGGLELVLACDIVVASNRARFADTHARVGAMPGAGLTILLPARIGPGRARMMSFTGDFVDATTAVSWGLADELVPHDQLLPRCQELAEAVATIPDDNVREIRRMYRDVAALPLPEAWASEQRWSREWMASRFDQARLAQERTQIMQRGRRSP